MFPIFNTFRFYRPIASCAYPLLSGKMSSSTILPAPHSLSHHGLTKPRVYQVERKETFPSFLALRTQPEISQASFKLWALGGLFLGGYLLNNHEDLIKSAYAEEPQSRAISVDLQTPNQPIRDPLALGLIKDLEHEGWYKIYPNSRFSAKLSGNGQLLWKSFVRISVVDVKEIADFYRRIGEKRALHINTGIHANAEGVASVDGLSGDFPLEDITAFTCPEGYTRVSFFIVTSDHPPYTHREKKDLDILDAWCFSHATVDFSLATSKTEVENMVAEIDRNSVPLHEIAYCFCDLGYVNPTTPNTKYIEFPQLKNDIRESLAQDSFCYVEGIGGMGKSRIAWELSKDIQDLISADLNTPYLYTIFMSLRSESLKEEFFRHLRAVTNHAGTIDSQLEKYFNLLGLIATKKGKKVFVVLDNIDTPQDFEFLTKVYNSLQKFYQKHKTSPFEFLVTGRRDLSHFFEDHRLQSENTVVAIEDYCQDRETIWKLFTENFLDKCLVTQKEKAKALLEIEKEKLLTLIENYGNHTGFTIVLSRILQRSFKFNSLQSDIDNISTNFQKYITRNPNLDDYGKLCEISKNTLEVIDQALEGQASKIYRVLALISDGPVNYKFLSTVLKSYYKEPPIDEDLVREVIEEFTDARLINHDMTGGQNILTMPTFINKMMRSQISSEYPSKKEEIDSLIAVILSTIEDSQFQDLSHENMSYLLSLFNYASDANLMYEVISEKTAIYASKKLHTIPYKDLKGVYNLFLSGLLSKPGYSLNPAIVKFIRNENIQNMTENLISSLTNELGKKEIHQNRNKIIKYLKTLNNLYVLNLNYDQNSITQRIKLTLRKCINQLNLQTDESELIIRNLESSSKSSLEIFPEIKFHKVSDENRTKAEKWKEKHLQTKESKSADLQGAYLNEGLRILIHYLLEEKKVEVIDLSHNSLGYSRYDTSAVCDLLKYPGTLTTLLLNNNTLSFNQDGNFNKILEGLSLNTTVETLALNNNSLGNPHINALYNALKDHKKITRIELHHNKFDDQGLEILENLMKINPHIQTITTYLSDRYLRRKWHNGTYELRRDQTGAIIRIKEPTAKL
ncbi:MAG: hypothetical protein AB7N99_07000 [Simkaniaceae bacterium]